MQALYKAHGEASEVSTLRHGQSTRHYRSPEYQSWRSMKSRVLDPHHASYCLYGGRGITVCDQWLDSFEAFYRDMGPRPAGCSLDRKDNNGHYSKDNCRWATPKMQMMNKRNNALLTLNGRTQPKKAWADELGIDIYTLRKRLRMGWSEEGALMIPVDHRRGKVKAPAEYVEYRVRICLTLHTCQLCQMPIRYGDHYHDGGRRRRAHVECVRRLNQQPESAP